MELLRMFPALELLQGISERWVELACALVRGREKEHHDAEELPRQHEEQCLWHVDFATPAWMLASTAVNLASWSARSGNSAAGGRSN